jgi:glutaredoxin
MPKITIYTGQNCPFSKKLKDFLYSQEIQFQEIKIDKNPERALELEKITQDIATPVTVYENNGKHQILKGWNVGCKMVLMNAFIFRQSA